MGDWYPRESNRRLRRKHDNAHTAQTEPMLPFVAIAFGAVEQCTYTTAVLKTELLLVTRLSTLSRLLIIINPNAATDTRTPVGPAQRFFFARSERIY